MASMQLGLLLALAAAVSATVKDPCRQPLKAGPCEKLVPRWYFSARQGKCLKFSWGGCQPNGNNFETLAACNKQCSPCLQPKKMGPCKARKPRYYFSNRKNRCLKFYWGGCAPNENNFESLKDCEKQCCTSGCGNPCKQPLKVGPCRAAITRFYYSAKEGKCMKFSWGGCQPNGNNFETLAACNKQCSPCLQPKKVGPCKARKPRYYFSNKKNRCLKFYWGGCVPNGNNFRTLAGCRRRCCRGRRCGAKRPKLCRLPKEVGPCRAAMPRYYFNGKRCAEFIYGGCGGNANNFRTVGECRRACRARGSLVSAKLLVKQDTSAGADKRAQRQP